MIIQLEVQTRSAITVRTEEEPLEVRVEAPMVEQMEASTVARTEEEPLEVQMEAPTAEQMEAPTAARMEELPEERLEAHPAEQREGAALQHRLPVLHQILLRIPLLFPLSQAQIVLHLQHLAPHTLVAVILVIPAPIHPSPSRNHSPIHFQLPLRPLHVLLPVHLFSLSLIHQGFHR